MKRDHTLPGEAIRICVLDTFVALMSGMIIFPACFAYGVQPDQGPSLIFITLTEGVCGYARRPAVGQPVLCVHVLRQLYHRHCGVREPAGHLL